jgi:hypothetical protein
MNPYEKAGIFGSRCVGIWLAAEGISGPFFAAATIATGSDFPRYAIGQWLASGVYTVSGILLIRFAIPLGRFLGRGLN